MTEASVIQRIENGLLGGLALTATIVLFPPWWWMPFATFLLFDLSALGYLRSSATGAATYNAVHNYAGPVLLAAIAILASGVSPVLSMWSGLFALSWAFHVGLDRTLGYGLKLPDAFTHTHLGWTGKDKDMS